MRIKPLSPRCKTSFKSVQGRIFVVIFLAHCSPRLSAVDAASSSNLTLDPVIRRRSQNWCAHHFFPKTLIVSCFIHMSVSY